MSPKVKIINYSDLVNALLANLPDREREVLLKRNAIGEIPEPITLEQIGKDYKITRERVRQIERDGIRKLRNIDLPKLKSQLEDLASQIDDYLKYHGGLMAEDHLKEKLLDDQKIEEAKALDFLLTGILAEQFNRVDDLDDYNIIWKLEHINLDEILAVAKVLKDLIENHGQPLHLDDLVGKFQNHELFAKVDQLDADNLAVIEALLRARKDVKMNILKQWGMAIWNTIRPKRMTDKAYLIMLQEKRPLHFSEVSDLINQANFDHKKACPATVHNELILDDKYVLVGRGIYALKDWGYQEGTVSEIITDILKDQGPQNKQDLMEKVLKQRFVQKTTIILSLMNKDRFIRLADGRYDAVK